MLTSRDVNEIADSPTGAVQEAVMTMVERPSPELDLSRTGVEGSTISASPIAPASVPVKKGPRLSVASISRDGKVKIEETESFSQLKT